MITSFAPRVAKCRAIARPIPRDAPVTMATLSWSVVVGVVVVVMSGGSMVVRLVGLGLWWFMRTWKMSFSLVLISQVPNPHTFLLVVSTI